MLTGVLRVQERTLRKRELDILPSLLARIDAALAKNPALDLQPMRRPTEHV